MNFDLEHYLPFLEGVDATLLQKEEMLRTVWGMMESQVDQAFGLHPVQTCQQDKIKLPITPALDLESSEITTVSSFNTVSANTDMYKKKA